MPPQRRNRRRLRAVTAIASSLLLSAMALGVTPAEAAPAVPDPAAPLVPPISDLRKQIIGKKLAGGLAGKRAGRQDVFVQLSGAGAADAAAATLSSGSSASTAQVAGLNRRRTVARTASAVVAEARSEDSGTKQLFQVANAVPGVAISATTDALEAVANRSDVVKVSPLVPKTPSNSSVAQLTRAVNSWRSPGVTGKGVKVGIIDTGIDYTHAHFGGPGTVRAFTAARATAAGAFRPTAKVVGGYDFVGDAYDPGGDSGNDSPKPDRNPLDCDGHGTHVAGSAAGFGVNADGKTFRGDYARLNAKSVDAMRIGPGMAPQASLYGLKVFGCQGSTNVVIPALDWALDPNGDGRFGDHLDIVNLSLGSDYSSADDPENTVVDKIAKHGVLPVISAGNGGDLTDIGGSPGNAARSLTVASSVDAYQLRDGLRVVSPRSLAGVVEGQMSLAYAWATKPDVTGDVVTLSAANADGCSPLSPADRAKVTGKVAWLVWDDNDATRACGSAGRANNVAAAGAIGALFTSGTNVFNGGITGSERIPVIQLTKSASDRLRAAAGAGTLRVTFSKSLQASIKSVTPSLTDTLSRFTSRGTHGAPGVVKPDVTAVGDTVASANVGTGNGVLSESGTSMAAPVTAGIAALVLKAHPTWSPERIKAAIMNTASHDLYTQPNRKGLKYGPARVGAGRVDALAAVRTKVLAYSTERAGVVSTSFGVVEARADRAKVTKTQEVRIRNTSSKRVSVKLSYQAVVKQPGVSYAVNRKSVSVKANSSAKVKVTMTVRTKQLRHTIDPTMAKTQIDTVSGMTRARQYVSDASGRLLVKPKGKTALRVPVYGAAKPVSVTRVVDGTAKGAPAIVVRGKGFDQGSGSTAFRSLLSVSDLGHTSRKLPDCVGLQTSGCVVNASARSADLQHVGAGATPAAGGSRAGGFVHFAVSTFGNWATMGSTLTAVVFLDVNRDREPDYFVVVENAPATDVLLAVLYDGPTGEPISAQPVNFHAGRDTNTFDTNTLVLPVRARDIGVTDSARTFPMAYDVATLSVYAAPDDLPFVDATPTVAFDAVAPRVKVGAPLYPDRSGTAIPYRLAGSSAKALVLHLHGRSGSRAEVQTLRGRASRD